MGKEGVFLKKIVYISDLDISGSGYFSLSIPLCQGLSEKGYDVRVIGLGNSGQEHNFDFSIIPVKNLKEASGVIQNLWNNWRFDVCIISMDIPIQEKFLQSFQNRPFKYVGIMPVESDPLCMSWAMVLNQMDKALIISQFGTDEARKAGVDADHIQLGIDTNSWRIPLPEERKALRDNMGFSDDDFVVLTVADSQERKNLSHAMDIIKGFSEKVNNVKYVLVTREHNPVGWKLRDYATEIGIGDKLMIFERGMDFKRLWGIYASSDAFLLSSKAEGYGIPVTEAMAVGIPVLATNCCGMREQLLDDRGILVDYDYIHRDPYGNGRRYWIDRKDAAKKLYSVYKNRHGQNEMIQRARNYVEARSWDVAVDTLYNVVEKVCE